MKNEVNLTQTFEMMKNQSFCFYHMTDIFTCVKQHWPMSFVANLMTEPIPPNDLAVMYMSVLGTSVSIRWNRPRIGAAFSDYVVAFRPNSSTQEIEVCFFSIH